MADYMLLVLEDEAAHASQPPHVMSELIEQRAAFIDGLRRAGRLRDSGRLRPSKEGKRTRRAGEQVEVLGGPFADGGKALGEYYWVNAASSDEAAQLAAGCPTLPSDEIDVRPLMKGFVENDKEAKPGKVFAFVVLGKAATEQAWIEVMDRIDAETDPVHTGGFLGGVRLESPKRGRRLAASQGERRALFDGPFLESKEVIGGVFFLRRANLEDALAWAATTRFVVHGSLEVREVWRS
jgi:hypothetical protein